MTQTWLSVAIKLPATFDPVYPVKFGYPGTAVRTLAQIEYVVNHSAEGGIDYLKQGQRPGEQASWMFSSALDGTLYQHFPLEAPTWTSGNPNANIHGVGVEHEGTHTQYPKFTDAQADTDCRLFTELLLLCPNLGAPIHGEGVRIHREVAPGTTTCPNGRDRYDKYALIGTEDELASAEAEALQAQITEQSKQIATNRQLIEDLHNRLLTVEAGPGTQVTGTFQGKVGP